MIDLDFFPSVNLIVSNACRMRCSFCCAETDKYKKSDVDIKKLFKIIDILHENGTQRICFSGGEPLLNTHLNELLAYTYNYNIINTIMSSDGKAILNSNFDPKYIDTFWISVHGIGNLHDNITNINGSFADIEKALENIRVEYPFAIWSVITPQNRHNIDKLVEWCLKYNMKRLYLSNINGTGKGKNFISKYNRIPDEEFEKMINDYQKKYADKIAISGQKFSKNAQCTLVYSDGSVYITPYDNEEDQLLVGNILLENPNEVFLRIKKDKSLWNDYTYRYKDSSINITKKEKT